MAANKSHREELDGVLFIFEVSEFLVVFYDDRTTKILFKLINFYYHVEIKNLLRFDSH